MEDAETQKYAIGNFRNFQMTENRDVSSQIHDYHLLINNLAIEDIKLHEPFVASYLVETLPESCVTTAKAKSKIFNGKIRHICLRHNIVQQLLETWVISLEFVRSKLNLVDPLIKPLNKKLVEETSSEMRLMPNIELKSDGRLTY